MANQGAGKARFRDFERQAREIVRYNERSDFWYNPDDVKEALELLLESVNLEQDEYFTPNWENLWVPRAEGLIDKLLIEQYRKIEDDEENQEFKRLAFQEVEDADELTIQFREQNLSFVYDDEKYDISLYRGSPEFLSVLLEKRKSIFPDLGDLLDYASSFLGYVGAITFNGIGYSVWVSK